MRKFIYVLAGVIFIGSCLLIFLPGQSTPDITIPSTSFDLLKQLIVTSPALAVLAFFIWWFSRSQSEREKRESQERSERDKRDAEREIKLTEERREISREYSDTTKGFLVAIAERDRLIKDVVEFLRSSHKEAQDSKKDQHRELMEKLEKINANFGNRG